MHLILCLDDRNGMLFAGRRQSKDRSLRQRILQVTGQSNLWMNGYSAKQFEETSSAICVDEDFLNIAGEDDYCFVENSDITKYLPSAHKLIIYRWNRVYPSDVRFPAQALESRKKISSADFPGSSHESITEEVYT